jgi:dTDP-4-amino-4,6-dideoxygalactose transaminase
MRSSWRFAVNTRPLRPGDGMILLNDFRRQWEETREAVLDAVDSVGKAGWYILGREVAGFEGDLARLWGLPHAIGVGSGLDALEISLRVLGCCRGDRVLTTPLSAFATTLAIVKLGAIPVFVDTDERGGIALDRCRDLLARRTDIRFLVPVHLYGHALDLDELARLRDQFGLRVVEDCAQSILASWDGRPTGTVGAIAATSFYPTKNLGAMGDAGAVLTSDAGYEAAARALRDYGQSRKYGHDFIGYNSRLDELQAAIMRRAYLPKLAGWTERRRRIATRYLEGIDNPGVKPIRPSRTSDSVWHLFPARVDPDRKEAFIRHARDCGVLCGEHYPIAIPDQRALRGVPCELAGDCATARAIARSEVTLPIHPYLADEEVERVIDCCNHWRG